MFNLKKLCIVLIIGISSTFIGCSGSGYNLINDYEGFYNAVYEGIANYEREISIDVEVYDENIYSLEVINDILSSNIEYNGNFENATFKVVDYKYFSRIIIEPEYYDSKETLVNRENKVNEKVQEIINSVITSEMSDYEKEKALHDYLVNNCEYDRRLFYGNMPRESYTAYGALIEGKAVCQGYAIAMDKLLKAVGIETMIVVGESSSEGNGEYENHAWNLVKLGENYYHVDSTWDDPVTVDGSNKLSYSYFNITDEEISLNHKWDSSNYPKANKKYEE